MGLRKSCGNCKANRHCCCYEKANRCDCQGCPGSTRRRLRKETGWHDALDCHRAKNARARTSGKEESGGSDESEERRRERSESGERRQGAKAKAAATTTRRTET